MTTPEGIKYTVVRSGALPSVSQRNVRPTDSGIAAVFQADKQTTSEARFPRRVTTRKTRIA
jgi:hypothetical protein